MANTLTLPFTLTLVSTGVTLSDSIADSESEIVDYTIPKGMAVAVRKGDTFYLVVADGTNTQITAGTARVKIADANKVTRITVLEAPLTILDSGGTPEDTQMQYKVKQGFSRAPDQHILVTIDSATAVDISQASNDMQLTGVQIVQL